jgi:hypothetical protein
MREGPNVQTSVKTVKLRGHEFESEVTVRHRTTLGRYEASVAEYPHLTGEGDTESLALDDLAGMLNSDPKAHDAIEAKNTEARDRAREAEKAARKAAEDAAPPPVPEAEAPKAHDRGAPASAPGGVAPRVVHAGVTQTLTPTEEASITKG